MALLYYSSDNIETSKGMCSNLWIGLGIRNRSSFALQPQFRNPIKILRELDSHQWLMFIAGWLGWTWDSFDFFTVSIAVTEIAEEFGVSNSDVTWVCTFAWS